MPDLLAIAGCSLLIWCFAAWRALRHHRDLTRARKDSDL